MNRAKLLKRLRAYKTTLVQNFGVTELALFGSFARDQAADDSDKEHEIICLTIIWELTTTSSGTSSRPTFQLSCQHCETCWTISEDSD